MLLSYFGFVEELSEAASRILLRVGRHLQDELHDYSLVRHLLHQCLFLQDRNAFLKSGITSLGIRN